MGHTHAYGFLLSLIVGYEHVYTLVSVTVNGSMDSQNRGKES